MKKFLPWIIASGVIMLGLPCLAVTILDGDSGMATYLILFFAVDPIYAICAGVYAGKDIKKLWASPILTALFFLAGTWLFFWLLNRLKSIELSCSYFIRTVFHTLSCRDYYSLKFKIKKALKQQFYAVLKAFQSRG